MNELLISLKDLVYRFFTSETGQRQEELPPSQQRLREYFKHHKFSDLLPYEAYDPITGLFHSEDSIGLVFEFSPTTGADDGVARIISGLFTQGLPDNVGIQCSIYGSPNILPRLTAWAGVRNGGKGEEVGIGQDLEGRREKRNRNIFQELARRRVGYLMQGAYQSLLSDQPLLIRDFRLILSITLPKPLPSQEALAIQRAVSLKASVISMFRSAGMPGYAMTADDFVDLLDDILNPRFEMEPKRNSRKWDPHERIKRQVVDRDTHYSVQRDCLHVNNMEVRSFSVQEYPTEWAVWLMGDLIGDFFENALRMPCPFIFTANIWVPDQVSAKNIGKMKQMRATQAVDSPIGRYAPVWKEKKAEWDFVNKKAAEGHTMCRVSHHVVLFARPGEGTLLESTVKSIYKQKGWKLVLDRWIQIQAFLESLPLMLDKAFARDMNTM
jgi:conjugal transfer ATP-binding protein TraC